MHQETPLHFSLSNQTGVITLSDREDLFYDANNLSVITHYDFDLQHLKAVYDVGIDELLKSDYLIGLELPKGYTIGHFIAQMKEDHDHSKESLQEHLKSLLNDMVRLLEDIRISNNGK